MERIAERMARAGIVLPEQRMAQGNYVPFLIDEHCLWISGQVSNFAGNGITGIVGDDLDLAAGQAAARLSGLNLLAQIGAALDGDFERIRQVMRITGHVQVAAGFTAIPAVMNGCSDLLVEALGERGRHTRTSVGAYGLPGGHAVEVDAVVRID
ncbi:MAG: RidA family protein [Sphingomonadales bacterium]|nr:MAG: RidA family protein [Sphingomonadales bacterium]